VNWSSCRDSFETVAKDTKRLPISYWRAGIAEYWLIDVRQERLLVRIHAHGADGYEQAPVDAEGFSAFRGLRLSIPSRSSARRPRPLGFRAPVAAVLISH
jgi:Uma2 family endonuclease